MGQGANNKEKNTLYTSYCTIESDFDLGGLHAHTQTRKACNTIKKCENAVESVGWGDSVSKVHQFFEKKENPTRQNNEIKGPKREKKVNQLLSK
jgi:hypothetical protein